MLAAARLLLITAAFAMRISPTREAQGGLAQIYGQEKAYYSEYAEYVSSLDAIGWKSKPGRDNYVYGFNPSCLATAPIPEFELGLAHPNSFYEEPTRELPPGLKAGREQVDTIFHSLPCPSKTHFTAAAIGSYDGKSFDVWTIDETKSLRQIRSADVGYYGLLRLTWFGLAWRIFVALLGLAAVAALFARPARSVRLLAPFCYVFLWCWLYSVDRNYCGTPELYLGWMAAGAAAVFAFRNKNFSDEWLLTLCNRLLAITAAFLFLAFLLASRDGFPEVLLIGAACCALWAAARKLFGTRMGIWLHAVVTLWIVALGAMGAAGNYGNCRRSSHDDRRVDIIFPWQF